MREVATQETGNSVEHTWRADRPETGSRVAIGRAFGFPGSAGVPIERGRERSLVAFRAAVKDRIGSQPRGHEGFVDPVSRERVDEPCRVADQQDSPSCGRGSESAHRESVPAHVRECTRVDAVLAGQLVEVRAQPRSFVEPAPDPQIRMVALRENPAVASGDDAELDPGGLPIRHRIERSPAHVCFESDAADDSLPELRGASDETIGAVGADDERSAHRGAADDRCDTSLAQYKIFDSDGIPEVRSGRGSLLRKVEVEPPALCHPNQGCLAAAPHTTAVPGPKYEAVDDMLDHRLDITGRMPKSTAREPATAWLVAREVGLVGQEHAGTAASEVDRRSRARRAGADDEHVEMLHDRIVGLEGRWLQLPTRQGFPSGQRGRAVNPLAQPSEVRILPPASPRPGLQSGLALLAQSVEHLHGKEGVDGSSPSEGSEKAL